MARKTLKIGVLIPRSGPAGIWAPSCEASAILAASEINAAGGLLGRDIELVIRDAGSTDRSAAEAASSSASLDLVEAVVAMVPSSARQPVRHALQGRIPFVYTPQFEGDEHHPGIITIGETAAELLNPGVEWLVQQKNASRFFLLGNNYIWPQRSMAQARRLISRGGGRVVGETEVPFGLEDQDFILSQIRQTRPHVVMSWLLGHEAVVFNRAFAESGLASRILRFSTSIDETVLYGIGDDHTENLYVSSAYFSGVRSRNNDAFLEKYHQYFGACPAPPNAFGESLYEGVHCLGSLAQAAGSIQSLDLVSKVGRSSQSRTARGMEPEVATGNRHKVHIAAVDGFDFRIITS
ncbi:ABC transporter substrate-binding protein [Rhizobium sp. CG5]|uniref:substrate-binding domain-containing protein n=1 Tax=Rhizobium sp. CG5 TaxID=2726076 RepID=UPI0020333BF5|nr:substrate-binding domain-containing protein [Rhizobium sp. CG5]MCM2477570.1 ABC transporter substrate-binding protein [Rhizobium sp. CG5]